MEIRRNRKDVDRDVHQGLSLLKPDHAARGSKFRYQALA